MSSSNSPALVLELPYGGRRLLSAGTLLLAALLLPWLAFSGSPVLRTLVMLGGVALAFGAAWQAGGVGSAARRLVRVTWAQNGEWRLQFAMGEPITAALAASSWWSPWVMCWRFVDEAGRRHGLLLWRSEFSPHSWHQWQLRLQLEGTHAARLSAVEPLR